MPMGLLDFLDGIPDNCSKTKNIVEETEKDFTYLKNHRAHTELFALQNLQYDDNPFNIAASLLKNANEMMQKEKHMKFILMQSNKIVEIKNLWPNYLVIEHQFPINSEWAIENNPKFIAPYFRCAQCFYQILHFSDALKFCNLALEISKEKEIEELKNKFFNKLKSNKRKTTTANKVILNLGSIISNSPWDQDQQYNLNNIECYIELDDGNHAKLNMKAKILSIMQSQKATVKEFIEIFLVCPSTNYYKKQFKSEYHVLQDQ